MLLISDFTLIPSTMVMDFKLNTVQKNVSHCVEETTRIQMEYCPHLLTQMHIQNCPIVYTMSLSPMEHILTSLSSPWTLIATERHH